ncbi:MAG: SRPBCC family protein [Bacteroidota bacterium]
METNQKQKLTIGVTVSAPVEKVWKMFNEPEHVKKWNNASPDWHTPHAENDVRKGGSFNYRMEARDGSFGFDFGGTYSEVDHEKSLAYTLGDGREVSATFTANGDSTRIDETFEAEGQNPVEMQQAGWQSILDNFKKYAESN